MELTENTTEIWLVRHGETIINKHQKYTGGHSIAIELDQNGIDQAQALGDYLKKLTIPFDYFYCSTTTRAQKTLEYCFPSQEYIVTDELLEVNQGDWEGKLKDEIYGREDVVLGLKQDNWNFVPGDLRKGESQYHVAQRMKTWITAVARKHKNKRVIAFTHGSSIKFLLADLSNCTDKSTAFKTPIDNTSITVILAKHDVDTISFSVLKQNDVTHLKEANLMFVGLPY